MMFHKIEITILSDKYFLRYLTGLIFCFNFLICNAQNEGFSLPKIDTVNLKEGQVFVYNNKNYRVTKDVILYIPSSVKYEVKPDKGEEFFNKLAETANKRRWTRELHNILIAPSNETDKKDSLKTTLSISPFMAYEGRPIRKIQVVQLDVFGPTIDDINRLPRNWLERVANKVHTKTKEQFIRKSLLFKSGEKFNASSVSDNERVLRQMPFIEDARIIVAPVALGTDSVDVVVITKDVWSIAFNLKVEDVYAGRFDFWDRNILGWGHEIQNGILWDSRKSSTPGYEGNYRVNNIAGSFVNGDLNYYNSFHTRTVGVSMNRSFFTPNVKYAGGLSFANTKTLVKESVSPKLDTIRYNSYDVWVGRSFLIHQNPKNNMRHNLTFSTRIISDQFFKQPSVTENSYYNLQDKILWLNSIGYSRQNFFKSNFIYNFGRTEDIPVGSEALFTMGIEKNQFIVRKYGAIKLAAGHFFCNWGYFYNSFTLGSFFNESNAPEQSILEIKGNYFSPLLVLNRYKIRQFVNVGYTGGINRFTNEYLTINRSFGLNGFKNDSVYGKKRFTMHWETDCFTPWRFYDFRVIMFLSADHCWIADRSRDLFRRLPYTGINFGIRVRNERLVFNTLQISFSFFPNIPPGSKTDFIKLSGESLLNPPSFVPQSPALKTFQ
ncbi:MAG: hypothetical protein Q8928_09040 [Bacteroidota bacterium]|nr:hypothetical protein [Bacteroidota bacterium]